MSHMKWGLLTASVAALSVVSAAPVSANNSADYFKKRANSSNVPDHLSRKDRTYYRQVFAAIKSERWDLVTSLLAERQSGPLHNIARAELYLAANSPKVELGPLLALLNDAPYIPQSAQLGRLATRRGAAVLPDSPQIRRLSSFQGVSRRGKPRTTADNSMPASTAAAIYDRIKNDDPGGARALLSGVESQLSVEARTEWQQRVAWSYYIENNDSMALQMAMRAVQGRGQWVSEAHWVAGLAAWRLNDCVRAAKSFQQTASTASNPEMRAAGYYWAARANMKCRAPENVQQNMRHAASYNETLYGLLARERLGLEVDQRQKPADLSKDDWKTIRGNANVKIAIGLSEIGETALADEVLRHQARIGNPSQHASLLRLARDLSLPAAQIFMAHNGPSGARPDSFARFPSPKWTPVKGWRVDPALVYAHTLQESGFRTNARSSADARGLMQVRPGTAGDVARSRGERFNVSDLYRPEINLEYGQTYLEQLKRMPQTQGLLPKIIAAYNAGPTPVARWNYEVRDGGDPLLFIESIPYSETRAYVGIILRNYWMYENQAGVSSSSAHGLAQGLWPSFPDKNGGRNVRISQKTGAQNNGD